MNYEKSHNLLLHTIHYNLKKLNELYLEEQQQIFSRHVEHAKSVELYVDSPFELKFVFYHPTEILLREDTQWVFNVLYPLLDIAKDTFPQFKVLFDWLESKKSIDSINSESCWCLGCKQNRTILFEERPSLGIPAAMVPIGLHGLTPPPSDFTLIKDMPTLEQENDEYLQELLHKEVCIIREDI